MIAPPVVTVAPWQRAQSGYVIPPGWRPFCGGRPWHAPQNTCELPVHTGVCNRATVSLTSFAPPPWQ